MEYKRLRAVAQRVIKRVNESVGKKYFVKLEAVKCQLEKYGLLSILC